MQLIFLSISFFFFLYLTTNILYFKYLFSFLLFHFNRTILLFLFSFYFISLFSFFLFSFDFISLFSFFLFSHIFCSFSFLPSLCPFVFKETHMCPPTWLSHVFLNNNNNKSNDLKRLISLYFSKIK